VSYVSFAGLNSVALMSSILFTYLYLWDSSLASSPGRLVAIREVCSIFIHFANFSALPVLMPIMLNQYVLCCSIAVLKHCSVATSWAYSACINLEILLKVKSSFGKSSSLPHLWYHTFCIIIALSIGIILLCFGALNYTNSFGCSYTIANAAEVYYQIIDVTQSIASTLISLAVLVKMWEVRVYTSFLVWHVMWTLCYVLLSNTIVVILFFGADNCFAVYTAMVITGSFNLILVFVRAFEPTVWQTLCVLVGWRAKDEFSGIRMLTVEDVSGLKHRTSLTEMGARGYNGMFSSLKTKFLIDSLTTLSLLFKMQLKTSENYLSSMASQGVSLNQLNQFLTVKCEDASNLVLYDALILNELFKGTLLEAIYNNSSTSPNFKLIEYYPYTFAAIRRSEGIELKDLVEALYPANNIHILSQLEGKKGGRSGSFVFSTHNKQFIIKTITSEEKRLMLQELLDDYTDRILSRNSMLVRVLGVFMLQCIGNYSVNLMIMENIGIPTKHPLFKLDLKGSTLNRKISSKVCKGTMLMKDIEFLTQISSCGLEEYGKLRFIEGFKEDITMLSSHGIMDYSVYGAYYSEVESSMMNKHCFPTIDIAGGVYTLGVIDILQQYSFSKRCENCTKRSMFGARASTLSAVDPQAYSRRLLDFCIGIL